MSRAVIGGGCFWCIEAVLQRLSGVQKVESGYAGGKTKNPTYSQVCSGSTGHAQVVRVHYNSNVLPYRDLLYIFMHMHDPTTLNQQGYDKGTQYRSIILYQSEMELETIRSVIKEVQEEYPNKIVTEVAQLTEFYPAEKKHQNYYNENSSEGYCRAVISPKIQKLKQLYGKYLDKSRM